MRRGLVVGKFSPLHRGHEFLITTALGACDEVLLLSYSQPEFSRCTASTRERWLREAFPQARVCVLDPTQHALPANDASDLAHRAFVARTLDDLGWRATDVFTSESYGDGFARHLADHWGAPVQHHCVDLHRQRLPVSGTAVRRDPPAQADWVRPQVLADLVPRVCLLGPESSGKTTLTQALAQALGTVMVPEFGRELWEQMPPADDRFTPSQLLGIAREQVRREELALRQARGLLVCDTSPLTTWVYAKLDHADIPAELLALSRRRYDLAILCEADFPFVQDGTRRNLEFAQRQTAATAAALLASDQPYGRVAGRLDQRVSDLLPILRALRPAPCALR
jgi:NadR type nicotinamide-nucleotide adenylyltransferase